MVEAKWKIERNLDGDYIVYKKRMIGWRFMDWFSDKETAEKYIKKGDPTYYDDKGNQIK